jgi:hypothetical protein
MLESDRLTIKLVGSVDTSAERPLPAVPHGASGLAGITDHTSVEDDLAGLDGSSSSLSKLGGGRGGGGDGRGRSVHSEDVFSNEERGSDSHLRT